MPTLQELRQYFAVFPVASRLHLRSLLFDYLSRTRGREASAISSARLQNSSSFLLTPISRGAFGMSFQTAWVKWRDSLVAREHAA